MLACAQVSWNRLDFLLLVLGILDLVLSMLQSNFLRILRVFRIQRLIALVSTGSVTPCLVPGTRAFYVAVVYSRAASGPVLLSQGAAVHVATRLFLGT